MGGDTCHQGGEGSIAEDRLVYSFVLLSYGEYNLGVSMIHVYDSFDVVQYFTNCTSPFTP